MNRNADVAWKRVGIRVEWRGGIGVYVYHVTSGERKGGRMEITTQRNLSKT